MKSQWLIIAVLASLLAALPSTAPAQKLAIQGGRIIPIAGDPIDEGVVLIEDGKIRAVGKELEIPIDAQVIDAKGKTVLPGFVDVHNSEGMSQANERNPNVPFLSVVDSIDPNRTYFQDCRRNGVTTAAVVPGNSTMIGGQAAIVKTAGQYVDDMLLKRHAGIKISLRPAGGSRMSHLARLRKELERARRAEEEAAEAEKEKAEQEKKAEDATKDKGKEDDKKDDEDKKEDASSTTGSSSAADNAARLQVDALRKLLRGEVEAFLYCDNGMDVLHALQLIQEYKLDAVLVLGRQCYRAAEQIADSKLPVILDPTLVFWQTEPRTGDDEKIVLPRIYAEHEIPLTFQVSSSSRALGENYLWYQAATAVKYGTPTDVALRWLTLRPAEILGIDEFVGSLEPGKDADLVILSGDPLKLNTWVEKTVIGGEVVYDRDEDEQLRELLTPSAD